MAVLGYCTLCDKLVTLRPIGMRWGERERRWFPVVHEGCLGHEIEIVDKPEPVPPLEPPGDPGAEGD